MAQVNIEKRKASAGPQQYSPKKQHIQIYRNIRVNVRRHNMSEKISPRIKQMVARSLCAMGQVKKVELSNPPSHCLVEIPTINRL